MKKVLLIPIMLLILFTACTPQKRLTRLIKHHPELVKTDSEKITAFIHYKDSTKIHGVDLDTNFWIHFGTDTGTAQVVVIPFKPDTVGHVFSYHKSRLNLDVYQYGNMLNIKLHQPDTTVKKDSELKIPIKVPVQKVEAKIDRGLKSWQIAGLVTIILFAFALVLVIILMCKTRR